MLSIARAMRRLLIVTAYRLPLGIVRPCGDAMSPEGLIRCERYGDRLDVALTRKRRIVVHRRYTGHVDRGTNGKYTGLISRRPTCLTEPFISIATGHPVFDEYCQFDSVGGHPLRSVDIGPVDIRRY